ncbi:hypothetical protein GCM10023215_46970 [Pseudonocardia yuanmonensis]|uniref:Uncharacterized protein n=1 Tax=Pseudonocardia yuanmonensis TaxID=1095914 RepID=A0ABP8X990_9PSEU
MTSTIDQAADQQLTARHRALWAPGDHPAVAAEEIPTHRATLVEAAGVRAGQRALDVDAGAGRTAIPSDTGAGTLTGSALSGRDRAILRAVGSGTAEVVVGAELDLYLEGRWCADQFAAHRLAHAGLIAQQAPGAIGQRVPARLTAAGHARLAA